jgi:undecaprenyl-diphosphatase
MEHSTGLLGAILMGLVQALTEFLPVSSSGHLVITKSLFKIGEVGITLEIVTHFATAAAVIIYLRRRIAAILRAVARRLALRGREMTDGERLDWKIFTYIVLATVPAGIVGLGLEDAVKRLFEDVTTTATMLVVTGVFLLLTGKLARERPGFKLSQALMVGVAQAVAIIPGLSRSGLTVGTGLLTGMEKRQAFEFSLLLSLPAILGATALEAVGGNLGGDPLVIAASALTAFVTGYAAIGLLFQAVIRNRFHAFGYYLVPAGIVAVVLVHLI